ncbi:MAG: hypothetical protein V1859_01630 [archaeon]
MEDSLSMFKNDDVARIVALINSDGHLQTGRRNLISFYSKESDEIDSAKNLVEKIFKINGKIYKDTRGNRYKLFFYSKAVQICLLNWVFRLAIRPILLF